MNNIHTRHVVTITGSTWWKSGTMYWHNTWIKCNW
jgi:hypothetical protein